MVSGQSVDDRRPSGSHERRTTLAVRLAEVPELTGRSLEDIGRHLKERKFRPRDFARS